MDFKKIARELGSIALFVLYFLLVCYCVTVSSCNSSKIVYKQNEKRLFQKADSLNMKVAPAQEGRKLWKKY